MERPSNDDMEKRIRESQEKAKKVSGEFFEFLDSSSSHIMGGAGLHADVKEILDDNNKYQLNSELENKGLSAMKALFIEKLIQANTDIGNSSLFIRPIIDWEPSEQ
jgi:hypothetical protein